MPRILLHSAWGYTRIERLTGGATRSGGREGRIVLAQSGDNEAVNRLHREYRKTAYNAEE